MVLIMSIQGESDTGRYNIYTAKKCVHASLIDDRDDQRRKARADSTTPLPEPMKQLYAHSTVCLSINSMSLISSRLCCVNSIVDSYH